MATGQTAQQNLETYKFLRKRLVNDFTLTGEGQGKSLVAERRAGFDYPGRLIYHADETSNMGYYIATLATEYQLLKLNGQSADATLLELGYAMKAINRLDETAESILRNPSLPSSPLPGDLNGFFLRSDVSNSFFQNNEAHFNSGEYGSSPVNGITSSLYDGAGSLPTPLKESQDQVLNLLMGLSFVSKFVNDSINGFIFQDNEKNFRKESKNISSRIVSYLRSNGWKIKDPVNGTFLSNAQGGEAHYLSYGFAEAACAIQNEFTGTASGNPLKRCGTFHDAVTTNYYTFFQHMKSYTYCPQGYSTSSTNCRNCHELYKPMLLASIGSSFYAGTSDVTATTLAAQGTGTEIQIIPLIHHILWNTASPGISDSVYLNMLNIQLPDGPKNNGTCDYPDFEWSAPVRWRQPERRGAGCAQQQQDTACFNFFPGEYNGLDYMLLFNLYALSTPGYVSYELNEPLGKNDSRPEDILISSDKNSIYIQSQNALKQLSLYSLEGRKVYSIDQLSASMHTLTTPSLSSGVYLISITLMNGHQINKKLFIPSSF